MASKILRHVHLRTPTTYAHASKLQDHLVRQLLTHKAATSSSSSAVTIFPSTPAPAPAPAPIPTILTFSPLPIYTTGRRELHTPLSQSQITHLTRPLPASHPSSTDADAQTTAQTASIAAAHRGGQITFHGPGQLVIYPIIDLKTSRLAVEGGIIKDGISPRCYVNLLEGTTIALLKSYGIPAGRTTDPGVWLLDHAGAVGHDTVDAPRGTSAGRSGGRSAARVRGAYARTDERGLRRSDYKIAALGVHLRRNVTSHGVGLNVETDLRWFDRIVACGLEGKGVTSMAREGVRVEGGVEEVGKVWVEEFARGLGMRDGCVVQVSEDDLIREMDG